MASEAAARNLIYALIQESGVMESVNLMQKAHEHQLSDEILATVLGDLMQTNRVAVTQEGTKTFFSPIDSTNLAFSSSAKQRERSVYAFLQEKGQDGCTIKAVQTKFSLKQSDAKQILDDLVKEGKLVKTNDKSKINIYVLPEFAPKGDIFHKDGKLDLDLIQAIYDTIQTFVYHHRSRLGAGSTLDVVHVQACLDKMVFSGILTRNEFGMKGDIRQASYSLAPDLEDTQVYSSNPCMFCPIMGECTLDEANEITPHLCEYLKAWSQYTFPS
ncbi:hypothetical protein BLNAU_9160 [Blattamonas nauphoetae]|uniref:DNA-directed RNA polymerase III subunit RPC6 n=1 Tax=Blattamonas nauphoetae TaxID=2049346 RepID=A0ABQ9XWG1_9EUKA|nr:hypothetical protein BLNAU_9160 [Blattamonas nauphoetae]